MAGSRVSKGSGKRADVWLMKTDADGERLWDDGRVFNNSVYGAI